MRTLDDDDPGTLDEGEPGEGDAALARTVESGGGEAALARTVESGDAALAATVATGAATADEGEAGDVVVALPEVSVARYRILGEVGRGGLGRVLRARDVSLGREVAVKEGHPGADESRFTREALITARLQHPAIVPVYEAGRWEGGAPFYAMKLVRGRPLAAVLKEARTLEARLALVPTVLAVADAIAYAHAEGVVHRDLKPENVLVGDFGETVVIDWGLAKEVGEVGGEEGRGQDEGREDEGGGGHEDEGGREDEHVHEHVHEDEDARRGSGSRGSLTVEGAVLGTPAYMAPEQAAGEEVDARADVYALGAMLYHVVTGAVPHGGKTVEQMLRKILTGDVVPVARREPRVPANLAAIIGKAMAIEPDARYPTARALSEDLRRFTTGQLVGAHRYSLGERLGRWLRRHKGVAAVAAVALAVLAAYGTWSVRRIVGERDRADRARRVAVAEANRAVVAQARAALARDPALALAWLRRMDPAGPGWGAARMIMTQALAGPLPERILGDLPPDPSVQVTADGRYAVSSGGNRFWMADLAGGATHAVSVPDVDVGSVEIRLCPDGRHAAGSGGHARDHRKLVTADLAAGTFAVEPWSAARAKAIAAGCVTARVDAGAGDVVWTAPGAPARTVGHGGFSFAWLSPDGHHAVAMSDAGDLTRWDEAGQARTVHTDLTPETFTMPRASSADGGLLAWASDDGVALVDVDADTRQTLFGARSDVIAVAPDGAWIAVGGPRAIELWRRDGTAEDTLEVPGRPRRLLASADGRWLVALGNPVVAFDLAGSRSPLALRAPGAIAALPVPGGRVVTIAGDRTARVWRLTNRAEAAGLRGADVAALSPDGRWVVFARGAELTRRRVGAPAGAAAETATLASPAAAATISDAGDVVVAGEHGVSTWPRGGTPSLHDAETFASLAAPAIEVSSRGVAAGWDGISAVVWDRKREWSIDAFGSETFPGEELARPLVFSPDGGRLAVAARSGVVIADLAAHAVRKLPGSRARRVAWSPDGAELAAGTDGPGLDLWQARTGARRHLAGPSASPVVAIAPDGRTAIGAGDGPLVAYDLAAGTARVVAPGVDAVDAAFLAAGRLATVDSHDTVTLWDLASAEPARLAPGDLRAVRVVPGAVLVATRHAVIRVPDDLPEPAAALADRLARAGFALEDRGGGAVVVTP